MARPQLLQNKVTAVTGALTGIGRAIAIGYLEHGSKVAINYLGGENDEALLADLKKEVALDEAKFIAVVGNIALPETGRQLVEAAVKKWGRLDIFISNAGVCQFADFLTQAVFHHKSRWIIG